MQRRDAHFVTSRYTKHAPRAGVSSHNRQCECELRGTRAAAPRLPVRRAITLDHGHLARTTMLTATRSHFAAATYREPILAAPDATDERLHSLDVLRGLALVFMVLVHFHQ